MRVPSQWERYKAHWCSRHQTAQSLPLQLFLLLSDWHFCPTLCIAQTSVCLYDFYNVPPDYSAGRLSVLRFNICLSLSYMYINVSQINYQLKLALHMSLSCPCVFFYCTVAWVMWNQLAQTSTLLLSLNFLAVIIANNAFAHLKSLHCSRSFPDRLNASLSFPEKVIECTKCKNHLTSTQFRKASTEANNFVIRAHGT